MSANISIKEGGKARMFNAARLRTVQPGGGTVDWVPKSEARTKTLYANENGIYTPAAEGVYAFNEVSVNVPEMDSFTGTGDNGNEYHYKKSGGGGGSGDDEIEVEKLPSKISITKFPDNLGPYVDQSDIDFTGIVVHAYDANNNDMGEIPFDELIFPEKKAVYDPDTEPVPGSASKIDIDLSPAEQPIPITDKMIWKSIPFTGERAKNEYTGATFTSWITKLGRNYELAVSDHPFTFRVDRYVWLKNDPEDTPSYHYVYEYSSSHQFTFEEATVYWYGSEYMNEHFESNVMVEPKYIDLFQTQHDVDFLAWVMIYGDITPGGNMLVPVLWNRPGDGKEIGTGYEIEVVSA